VGLVLKILAALMKAVFLARYCGLVVMVLRILMVIQQLLHSADLTAEFMAVQEGPLVMLKTAMVCQILEGMAVT
jgi:hypothetical protein